MNSFHSRMKHTLTLLSALLLPPLLGAADATHSTVDAKDKPLKTLVVANQAGLRWELLRTKAGWSLGGISFHEKPVEQPATKGLLVMRNVKSGEVRWLAASKGEKIDAQTASLSGQEEIDGVTFLHGRWISARYAGGELHSEMVGGQGSDRLGGVRDLS